MAALIAAAERDDYNGDQPLLLEEMAYRYEIKLDPTFELIRVEPEELLSPDDQSLRSGRLSVGRTVGHIRISLGVRSTNDQLMSLRADLEVRSRKLDYDTEYRQMLGRVAERGAELVQSSFAAGQANFTPSPSDSGRTIYQRFAFLEALLESELFEEAMETIRYHPHTRHEPVGEEVDPAKSLKPTRQLVGQLVKGTQRQAVGHPVAGLSTVPRRVVQEVHGQTLDTTPNRFVRYALEHWRTLAANVAEALTRQTAAGERGRRAAQLLQVRLDRLLEIPAVAAAGPLDRFPGDNMVLNSRAGYREVLRSFLLAESGGALNWEGGEDVFGAGQRNAATLYEYWVFLELASTIEVIPGFHFDHSELLEVTDDQLSLELRRNKAVVLRGSGIRRNRRVRLQLWFNRSFPGGREQTGSWTVLMRPDCSLRIAPQSSWASDTWIHFDAKYRVDRPEGAADSAKNSARPKNDDLRKMHAYRDGIRRSAGAFVLYPGDDGESSDTFQQYHEILPGIGALVLRPGADGRATAVAQNNLQRFITDVIDHAAAHGTGRERSRYWEDIVYSEQSTRDSAPLDYQAELVRPPADSEVLLGFVRSAQHWEWIVANRQYNLRCDPERNGSVALGSRTTMAEYVVLYDKNAAATRAFRTTGTIFIRSSDELIATGYPARPGSSTSYLCFELGDSVAFDLAGDLVRELADSAGAPTMLSWQELSG